MTHCCLEKLQKNDRQLALKKVLVLLSGRCKEAFVTGWWFKGARLYGFPLLLFLVLFCENKSPILDIMGRSETMLTRRGRCYWKCSPYADFPL